MLSLVHHAAEPVKKRILVAAGNVAFADQLQDRLTSDQHRVEIELNPAAVVSRLCQDPPDLAVIDVNLSGESGLSICKLSRRQFAGGIILVGQQASELDQVLGLDMGADDYIPTDTSPRLFQARCNAILRRTEQAAMSDRPDTSSHLSFTDLVIDRGLRLVSVKDQVVEMTATEFDLLWLLCSRYGEVLSRDDISLYLRNTCYNGRDRSVDILISRIRPKIGDDAAQPRRIKTIRCKGYLFAMTPSSPTPIRHSLL